MPDREAIDIATRQRIAGHLRKLYMERHFKNIQEMADALHMSRSALSRYLFGLRMVGLDVVVRVHRHLNVSVDYLLDHDPPAEYLIEPQSERRTVVFGKSRREDN